MPLPGILLLIDRFPQYWGRISELGESDEKFRGLCRDYQDAVDAARRWQDIDGHDATRREQEYIEVIQQLEEEVLEIVQEDKMTGTAAPDSNGQSNSFQ